jgi:hypothetical protein
MPIDPVRGSRSSAGASHAASAQEPLPDAAQDSRNGSPRVGQRRSAADAGLDALTRRPTTPELRSATANDPPRSIQRSALHALAQPEVRRRLEAQGIALHSHAAGADGQATTRPSTVTPFLEEGRLSAEHLASQLPPTAALQLSAYKAGEALRGLDVIDSTFQPVKLADDTRRRLGVNESHAGNRRTGEATAINNLARRYVAGVDAAGSQRMDAQQRHIFVNLSPSGGAGQVFQKRMLKFVEDMGSVGPRAAGFVAHASLELAAEARSALMEALLVRQSSLQELIDAAHLDQPLPEGLREHVAAAAQALRDAAAGAEYFRSAASGTGRRTSLGKALSELQPRADRTHGHGLRWLLEQPPSVGVLPAAAIQPDSGPDELTAEHAAWVEQMLIPLQPPDAPEPDPLDEITPQHPVVPERPTTPELLSASPSRARPRVLTSAARALENPGLREELRQQGISLHSIEPDVQGNLHRRDARLTPLLDQAERAAAPLAKQMMPMAAAEYTAYMVSRALRDVAGAGLAAESTLSEPELSFTNSLAVVYTAAVDAHALPGQGRLGEAQRTAFLEARKGPTLAFQARIDGMVLQLGAEGPRAAAFLTHAVPLREFGDAGAGSTKPAMRRARSALLQALLAQPGTVQRLVVAAHRGSSDADACKEVDKECALLRQELATAHYFAPESGPHHRTELDTAFRTLSQPGSPGMQWLLSQRPLS